MKGRKHDSTGRSKGDARHVRLYEWFQNTAAWRSLSPADRVVYISIENRFHGANNGRIGLSLRSAAQENNISKATAAKAFDALIDRCFIELCTPSGFRTNDCRAPEWRLTRAPCDITGARATEGFKRWTMPAEELERLHERKERRAAHLEANLANRSPKMRTVLSETRDSRRRQTA